tara:strand:+ start:353 stop:541 length:189 start_codon:yes stop_codon:yes gene_type:complete
MNARYPLKYLMKMEENEAYELMYRRPGADTHENITKVLDDILIRLEKIETALEFDDRPGLTD